MIYLRILFKIMLLIIVFEPIFLQAQMETNRLFSFKTLFAEFNREIIENTEHTYTIGFIYFYLPGGIVIDVRKPVDQLIKIDSNLMIIYYPKESRVIKISSSTIFSLPILSPILSVTQNDFGLTSLGYTLKEYNFNGDTLVTIWTNKNLAVESSNLFVLKFNKERIYEVLVYHNNSELLLKKIKFDNYVNLMNDEWLPQSVMIFKYKNNDIMIERISLNNIQLDIKLPDSIINFQIPSNSSIEEIIW